MVQREQFLERPAIIATSNQLVLEGLAHRGAKSPPVLILPPPHFEGGGMDHVVGAEIAFAVWRSEHPSLRFNYRGVGASQGKVSANPDDLLSDALAAYTLAVENASGHAPLVVALFGSDAVAVQMSLQVKIAGLVLISPTLVMPSDCVQGFGVPAAVVMASTEAQVAYAAWSDAASRGQFQFEVIPDATRAYLRNLPQVARVVIDLLHALRANAPG